jgi:ABC-2 type transport system ATP-binding protein
MWQLVRGLKAEGVTIILTTHYIDEAEEMADLVGVINKGEIVLVEDKVELMRKLGRKQLTLELHRPLERIPQTLAPYGLELSADGARLVYTYEAGKQETGIVPLLDAIAAAGIGFKDLKTTESSLEEIFVRLVREEK